MKKENLEKITELRHELHRHAELSMEERETAEIIRRFLRENTRLRVVDRGGWFYAVKEGSGAAGAIAFRADMDALPIAENAALPYHSLHEGVSHRCGHDGHSAALCGLALELDGMPAGPAVYLIFQPGEETGQGAEICRELIKEKGIGKIFAVHNLGGYPEGSVVYRAGLTQPSSEGLRMRFCGRTSHASAPEDGKNPSGIISRVILYTEELCGRQGEWTGMTLCTVTGIRLGSGDFGISPGEGELCLTLRAENESEMKQLEEAVLGFAGTLCGKAEVGFDFSIRDYFPETRNDDAALDQVLRAAERLGKRVIPMEKLWRASEDFGWYQKECPGAMVYIGNGEAYPALHTTGYDFNDAILETAADLFAEVCRESG